MTLKELREQHGLYQKQLASMLHVNRSEISKWENGTRTPTLKKMARMAKIFDKPLGTIMRMFTKGGSNA